MVAIRPLPLGRAARRPRQVVRDRRARDRRHPDPLSQHAAPVASAACPSGCIVGVPLGVLTAKFRDKPIDRITLVLAMIGISLPTFWLGRLLQFQLAYRDGLLPVAGFFDWQCLILPSITLGVVGAGYYARLVHSNMVEVLEPGLHPRRPRPRPVGAGGAVQARPAQRPDPGADRARPGHRRACWPASSSPRASSPCPASGRWPSRRCSDAGRADDYGHRPVRGGAGRRRQHPRGRGVSAGGPAHSVGAKERDGTHPGSVHKPDRSRCGSGGRRAAPPRRRPRRSRACSSRRLLIGVVLLAGGLRFFRLGAWSFTNDESATLVEEQSLFGAGDAPPGDQTYRLPRLIPLAYTIQHIDYLLFGRDEWGSRVAAGPAGNARRRPGVPAARPDRRDGPRHSRRRTRWRCRRTTFTTASRTDITASPGSVPPRPCWSAPRPCGGVRWP